MSSSPGDSPLKAHARGVLLAVRLQPGARAPGIDGIRVLDDGQVILAVRVSEPPEKGKANTALIRLLAKSWRLPKSSISFISGQHDRRKLLLIEGEAAALMKHLTRHLGTSKNVA